MTKFIFPMRFLLALTIFFGLLFSAGCAYFQHPPSFKPTSWRERQVELRQITAWDLSGALSITYNKKRDMVHFQWIQNNYDYTINISGPLNINNIRIIGNANGVTFWRTKKKCIRASTPEQLTYEQLGWQLPVSNMRYWILARPIPGKIDTISFDQYGHLVALEQDGWQIKYSEFQASNQKNIDLPKTIELKNEELAIKIKVTKQVLG